jgi:hypothetical protein
MITKVMLTGFDGVDEDGRAREEIEEREIER